MTKEVDHCSSKKSGTLLRLPGGDAHALGRLGITVDVMESTDPLTDVYLPDSWVLGVETTDSSVCFVLEAALPEGHPRFYSPPRPGEHHSYTRLRWCLRGAVHWNEGPNLDKPATDANGEQDYGHIDVWLQSGDRQMLEGDWGNAVVDRPTQSIEYLD